MRSVRKNLVAIGLEMKDPAISLKWFTMESSKFVTLIIIADILSTKLITEIARLYNQILFERYGDMQLIAEAYHLMKDGLGLSHSEMASILSDWNQGELDSFLIEITANILKFIDDDGMPLVNSTVSISC